MVGRIVYMYLKTKAAPHGEAFTININLKNFIHEKIIYLFLSAK